MIYTYGLVAPLLEACFGVGEEWPAPGLWPGSVGRKSSIHLSSRPALFGESNVVFVAVATFSIMRRRHRRLMLASTAPIPITCSFFSALASAEAIPLRKTKHRRTQVIMNTCFKLAIVLWKVREVLLCCIVELF